MEVVFILNNPAHPGNVGSVARAIKTMGFSELLLVNPCNIEHQSARNMAYQSHDILYNAKILPSLEVAISDLDLIIGTTAKKRSGKDEFIDIRSLNPFIKDKGKLKKVGIVFGSEENGLSNDELDLCDVISTVPMANAYPSLNLAQSVMIYAYELACLKEPDHRQIPTGDREFFELKEKSELIFNEINVVRNPQLHQRIKDRLRLVGETDTKLILTFIKYLERSLKGLEN